MKRIYNEYTVLILAVALLFSSCRRPIEEVVDLRAVIPMGTLWEKAGIVPQNVTALFYSKNDGKLVLEHRFENSANRIQTYAYVPEGGYTVVVFNEIRGQLYGVGIRGYENLSTRIVRHDQFQPHRTVKVGRCSVRLRTRYPGFGYGT